MEKREKVAEEVIESYMESALQRLKQEHQKSIQRLTLCMLIIIHPSLNHLLKVNVSP